MVPSVFLVLNGTEHRGFHLKHVHDAFADSAGDGWAVDGAHGQADIPQMLPRAGVDDPDQVPLLGEGKVVVEVLAGIGNA
jgi:hypothetical protein